MVNLNTSLFTGFSGVQTAQTGLNIIGNNIANVNTEGYSRQRADIITRGIITTQGLTTGHGSDVRSVMAMRDNLVERFLTDAQGNHGYAQTLASGFNELEGLLAETDGTGIGYAMNEFFSALEAASLRPSDLGSRQELLSVADNLASEFRLRDSNLVDHQNQTNTDMLDLVAQVNEITERIDAFNRRISATPTPAQNLIDDRNNEIKQLSELVGVEVFQLDNNMVQVNLKGPNVILVGREIRNELGTEVNTSTGFYDITHVTKGNSTVVTNDMVSGKLAAKIQLRDVGLQGVRDKLDTLAGSMIVEMSSIHDNGFDLNGNTNLRFFDPPLVTVLGATPVGTVDPDRYRGMAGTISLSTQLIDPADPNGGYDPTRVALSATGSAGDNGIALQMADLQHSVGLIDLDRDGDPSNDNSETFQKFFNTTMGEVGRTVRNANDGLDTQIALLEQAEVRREQVSGVSLDEEAVHLSQFQRAFEASSRFLNVINQLTAEIINRLG